ncbi:MAG: GH92 family glycosyl hydrolase [Lactobacillales bacterium]|jgi:predicted alpha-1,2-mannosidase|nr:GH92 family glycosyl hydrolase [Lactobacillales bacterium]
MNVEQIDVRHGTDNQPGRSHGNCLPLTGLPHGMNYFAPQTLGSRGAWWFHPFDSTFEGFRLTHQPSPWVGDFTYLLMQPYSGELTHKNIWGATTSYDKERSQFHPHELTIFSNRYGLESTLIPSTYGGCLKIKGATSNLGLLLQLAGERKILSVHSQKLTGWVSNFVESEDSQFKMYFSFYSSEEILNTQELESTEGETISLDFGEKKEVNVTFATSFISAEQAELNLSRELKSSWEEKRQTAKQSWEEIFAKIELTHANQQEVSIFYHNMYRAFLFPMKFYELDERKRPIHYQTMTQKVMPGVYYTNNGFWDTSKTVYPLYSLIAVDKLEEMLEGFLNCYQETGYLPKWLSPDERGMMPGTLIDSVIADAAVKGVRLDLMPKFLEAMIHSATVPAENSNYGRASTKEYQELGYVPNELHESVNQTQDNAYSDYCISQVAFVLGKEELGEKYQQQSLGYRKLIDVETGLMKSRDKKGKQKESFDSHEWGGDYTEGSAWQNSLNAYHDIEGYIQCIGGKERFLSLLTELANQAPVYKIGSYGTEIHEMTEMYALDFGQVAISNQPSFHVPYLFNYVNARATTQVILKHLCQVFTNGVDAYPGDEDNGSLSSWFIFSSLGFYPVVPGSGNYELGIPMFDSATIHLSNGKELLIKATPNKRQHQFVDRLTCLGETYNLHDISHMQLLKGGEYQFTLGIAPRF